MTDETTAPHRFTVRQKVFINEYPNCFNQAEAARRAGYSEKTARMQGHRLFTDVYIKAAIDEKIAEMQMCADEALVRLADMARADMGDFMAIGSIGFSLDLESARKAGITKLIRKVKQKTTTFIAKKESDEDREVHEIEIELYDAQTAIDKILRVAGRYVDRTEVTGKDGKDLAAAVIQVYLPDNGRNDAR